MATVETIELHNRLTADAAENSSTSEDDDFDECDCPEDGRKRPGENVFSKLRISYT